MQNFSVNSKNSDEKSPLLIKKKLDKKQATEYSDNFQKLPTGILITIASFLELKDVIELSEVNKTIRKKITSSNISSQYPIMRVVFDENKEFNDEQLNDHKVPKASWQQIFSSLKNKNQMEAKFKKNQQPRDSCSTVLYSRGYDFCSSGKALVSGAIVFVSDLLGIVTVAVTHCLPSKIIVPIFFTTGAVGVSCFVCGTICMSCGDDCVSAYKAKTGKESKIRDTLSFFKKTPKNENTLKTQGIPVLDENGDFIDPKNEYPKQFTMN